LRRSPRRARRALRPRHLRRRDGGRAGQRRPGHFRLAGAHLRALPGPGGGPGPRHKFLLDMEKRPLSLGRREPKTGHSQGHSGSHLPARAAARRVPSGTSRIQRIGAMGSDGIHTTTKKELVSRIADQTGQTKVVVKQVLQAFLDEIVEELSQGNRLEFREFGVFEVKERRARRAQNPRTLEKVDVPAKRIVKFKVGREMRAKVCDETRTPKRAEPKAAAKEVRPEPAVAPRQPSRPTNNSPF